MLYESEYLSLFINLIQGKTCLKLEFKQVLEAVLYPKCFTWNITSNLLLLFYHKNRERDKKYDLFFIKISFIKDFYLEHLVFLGTFLVFYAFC